MPSHVRDHLMRRAAELAGVPEIDPARPLQEYGLGSRDAVVLAGEIEELSGRALPATLLWETPTVDAVMAYLEGAVAEPVAGGAGAGEPVAVVGIGCRFPGGAGGPLCGPAAYWAFLMAGGDAVTEVPEGRWASFDDGSAEVADALARVTRYGGFLGDVAGFDAGFFGIPPAEARLMDPQQRLLLEVAWEALEHAGIPPSSLAGSATGVFAGISTSEYAHLTAADLTRVEAWTATGAAPSVAAGRLSYLLDLRGPSLAVDTACSSSLVAVDLAARSLSSGESDLAIAGGVNLMLSPAITMTFDAAGGTSPTGRCRAFDAAADGMVRGEGCGIVVLKRLPDARRDGDRVLAVLRGGAVNADGRSNGLVAPSPAAQRAVLRTALARTGLTAADIGYVEAHGTGTPLGDPIEASALGAVLGTDRERPLLLGSAKTNLGHLEAAAGAAGLIKTVLALEHRRIPPSLHFAAPNPEIPCADLNLEIVTTPRAWPGDDLPRAGVSSFGFSGVNAHLILEAPPPGPDTRGCPAPVTTYVLHDRTPDRVRAQAAALAEVEGAEPGDIAYTLVRRAGRGDARATVTGRTRDELAAGLRALGEGRVHAGVATGRASAGDGPGVAFVFAGQGSQWAGMGAEPLRDEPVFRDVIEEIDALARPYVPFSLRDVLERGAEPPGVLGTQVTLFGVQIALARLWQAYGVRPAAVLGHSMGEVAAAVVSGGLSLADGIRVIATRATLLEALAGRGAMAVLGIGAGAFDAEPGVHLAVETSPEEIVVTGDVAAVEDLVARVAATGRPARLVRAQGAGHSPQVDPLLPELRRHLADLAGDAPVVPWYATSSDDPRHRPRFGAGHWAVNLRSPVRLAPAVRAAAEDGYRTFVEISAHPVLARALRANLGDDAVIGHSLRRGADGTVEFHAQRGALHVAGVQPPPRTGTGRLADLPPAPWRHVPHWVTPPRRRTGGDRVLGVHVPLPDGRHAWHGVPGASGTVHGVPVLTLAAAAELAHAAARGAGLGPVRVRDLRLHGFLRLDEDTAVTTALDGDALTVSARDASGAWHTYVTGRLVPGAAEPGGRDLPRSADGEPVAVRELDGDRVTGLEARSVARWEVAEPLDTKLFAVRWAEAPLPPGPETPPGWAAYGRLDDALVRALGPECDDPAGVVIAPETVLEVTRAVADLAGLERPPRLWIVARASWFRGLVRTLAFEHPALHPTLLDGDDPADLAREIRTGAPDDEVRWRKGVRYVARLARCTREAGGVRVRRDGAYVITGGLGGLGLAVAGDLARRGAGRVVLNARSAPSASGMAAIGEIRARGGHVDVVRGDAADPRVARALVAAANAEGTRLRGVVHAAGVADDRMAVDITAADLARVWHAKVETAESLNTAIDEAGADAPAAGSPAAESPAVDASDAVSPAASSPDAASRAAVDASAPAPAGAGAGLDFWVAFSSAAALLGSPGQGAYAAANARLDEIAVARGGTTINWGTWAETGAARDDPIRALTPLTTREALEAFGVLAGSPGATGVLRLDADAALTTFPEITEIPFFADVLEAPARDDDWPGAEAVRNLPAAQARAKITTRIRTRVAALAGLDPAHLTPDAALGDLGVDSLIAQRLVNVLTHDLAVELDPGTLLGQASLADVEAHVLAAFTPDTQGGGGEKNGPAEQGGGGAPGPGVARGASESAASADGDRADASEPSVARGASGSVASAGAAGVPAPGGGERIVPAGGAGVPASGAGDARGAGAGVGDAPTHGGGTRAAPPAPGAGGSRAGVPVPGGRVARGVGPGRGRAGGVVVPLQVAGDLPPFCLAHPAGGDSSVYRQLVGLLGDERPVYGLERLDGRLGVVERAARYVGHLPGEGPYILGGWSFGGILAYEMARRIPSDVELVVMIDSGLPLPVEDENAHSATRFAGFAAYVARTYGTRLEIDERELRKHDPDTQLGIVLEQAERANLPRALSPAAWVHQRTSYEDTRALERYVPGPYDGRVVLYRATERTPWTVDDPRYDHPDPSRGFAPYCRDLEVVAIRGHHLNLLDPPQVGTIAAHLRGLVGRRGERNE